MFVLSILLTLPILQNYYYNFSALLKVRVRGHQMCMWASAVVGYVSSREPIVLRWDSKTEGEVSLVLEC